MRAVESPRGVGAVVLATMATTPGGVWRHMLDLASGLRGRGIRVRFALPPAAVALADQARLCDFSVTPLAGGERGSVWHLHLADTFHRRSIGPMVLARLRSRAVVLTEHLPRSDASDCALARRSPRRGAWSAKTAFKKTQFALADRIITVSEGSRGFLLTRYGIAHDKVSVVANGIAGARPEALASPTGQVAPGGPPRIVAVGSVIHQKGFDVLLSAFAASRCDWVADIVGDGPHRLDLARRASADRSVAGRLRFRGWAGDVGLVLAQGDIAVLPSRWEGSPYAALEAMAAGLPVVASRIDGLSEVVVDRSTGFLIPPDDPVALARAIDTLAADRALARRMGALGRLRVQELFGAERMVERTLGVYESALNRDGRRSLS